jgi:glycosyltransferase involved in cell wall biosynthesis
VPSSTLISHERVTDYLSTGELRTLLIGSLKYMFRRPRPELRIVRDLPPGQPLVSVIIPTFNRSNVLRCAIHSVLWQTETNFELLVVGDGCTDDSESVARSFGDARVSWHNLPSNSGHQSAPVNAGLAMSRGRYIALLGHDDIWHPEHLRTLLSAITSSAAGVAVSVIEMRGPKHAGYRVLAGIFPGGRHDPAKCSPPSALMVSREVYERIGGWHDYRTVWRNPECEFQHQAYVAGFRFVSTGELTVYKFTSVLWKNAYFEKPCGEQKVYLERIQKQRWFLLKETLDIAWVHLRRLPMYAPAPPTPPEPHTPGWHVSHYRKFRGLD